MSETISTEPVVSSTAAPARRRWRTVLFGLPILTTLLWFVWEILHVLALGNVHTVIPGKLYRGAQPTADTIDWLVRTHGIRTVINVRGCSYPEPWFVAEAEACQRLGVHLEDITMSAMH